MILDNAPGHTSMTLNNFIESMHGKIVLIYLPSHTPQLNPIEPQWTVLKRLIAGRDFKSAYAVNTPKDYLDQKSCNVHPTVQPASIFFLLEFLSSHGRACTSSHDVSLKTLKIWECAFVQLRVRTLPCWQFWASWILYTCTLSLLTI